MEKSNNVVTVREAECEDIAFIHSLSSALAAGAQFEWHKNEVIQKFQDDYITEMMATTNVRNMTLVAEKGGVSIGFIHVRESEDEISGESCGTVPLLAVAQEERGAGVGALLMREAEVWAKAQGFRILHLEVFSTNERAEKFYQNLGFRPETIHMIKPLE